MDSNEGRGVSSRWSTLPPISNRTLHHPSFLPLYLTSGFAPHHIDRHGQTIHAIIPEEFYYSDPTSYGRRVPNIVSDLRVLECFQLNTPLPIMSACPAPPTRPDPFRSGPYPTRDLGSLTRDVTPFQPNRVVLQLTEEEDQAVTNLLKLHHVLQGDGTQTPQTDPNPEEEHETQQGRRWSAEELEVANTLLSRLSLEKETGI